MREFLRGWVLTAAGFGLVMLAAAGALVSQGSFSPLPDAGKPEPRPVFMQMYVHKVIPVGGGQAFAVELVDSRDEPKIALYVFIGENEAVAIALALSNMKTGRPMTHDLLKDTIDVLDWRIASVSITKLEGDTFYGELELKRNSRSLRVDSRPSDAMALAVRAGAPIYVAESVVKAAARKYSPEGHIPIRPPPPRKKPDRII